MMNEAQIILVRSISDLLGRFIFSTALISAFMVVKSLVRQRDHSVAAAPAPLANVIGHNATIKPSAVVTHTPGKLASFLKRHFITRRREFRSRALHWMNWLFMIWGIVSRVTWISFAMQNASSSLVAK